MNDILLFGIPGAGKGTQAELLSEEFPGIFSHLSTGDIFRALTGKPNAIGDYVNSRMKTGKYIDDHVTISLFNAYFYAVLDEEKHMLLDGYPRTVVQLQSFLTMAKKHKRPLLGINFTLSDEQALERLLSRGREGETKEMLAVRLKEFYTKTKPIIDLFGEHGTLIHVDANRPIDVIAQEVKDIVSQ